jgi:uncharacterized protein
MFLDLSAIFHTPGGLVPFDYLLPASYDALPFAQPPQVTGQVRNRAGIVELTGEVQVRLAAQCNRCAEDFVFALTIPLAHTLVQTRESEESDELIVAEGPRFALDDLVWEDIVLAIPSRLLCKPDCKGLCPHCGQNRNEAPCACKPMGDPRLAALQRLLDD